VVALSDSDGDSCQSYEYSAYGQVAASDPNFLANPYMFTGRRFDIETGLYYYRTRYYNPHIGRFMQTDPVGYGAGINWYMYCGNNPLSFVDPWGLDAIAFYNSVASDGIKQKEMADDFISFDIKWGLDQAEKFGIDPQLKGTNFILWVLEMCNTSWDIDVTDIYIFGHGGWASIQIGWRSVGADNEYDVDFWEDIGELAPNAAINLRTCNSAKTGDRGYVLIEEVALLSGLTVTGVDGAVLDTVPWWIDNSSIWRSTFRWEGTGPDYEIPLGCGFYRAEVQEDGTVNTSAYWINTFEMDDTNPFHPIFYNPWGPQPY